MPTEDTPARLDSASTPVEPASPKTWKWIIRLLFGIFMLLLLLSKRETASTVGQTLRAVPPLVLVGSVVFYWMGQLLSAWRWHVLLKTRGRAVPYFTCCRFYVAGMFGNLFLPTTIGGDALRAFLLTKSRSKVPLPDAAASILMDRVTGFVALLIIATLGTLVAGAARQVLPILVIGTLALAAFVYLLLSAEKLSKVNRGPLAKLQKVTSALSYYAAPSHRGALGLAVVISMIFQASQVLHNLALARAAGLTEVPTAAFFYLVPVINLSAMIPLGIGGLGVREAAAVALLKGAGYEVGRGIAIAWSLLWQATIWLASLPGAFFVKPKETTTRD